MWDIVDVYLYVYGLFSPNLVYVHLYRRITDHELPPWEDFWFPNFCRLIDLQKICLELVILKQ